MKRALLDFLVCPSCVPREFYLRVRIAEEVREDIREGHLTCEHCGKAYPIRDGIAFLEPPDPGQTKPENRYETGPVLSSYLWSHYGDLLQDPEASDAYTQWADLMKASPGICLDIGCAVGRFTFEMSRKSDFVVGLDNSVSFIRAARELMLNRRTKVALREEGLLAREVILRLPDGWDRAKVEFVVGDALALPFVSNGFSSVASLNLVDKVALPLKHLLEMNRVAKDSGTQFLLSDPFSWSTEAAREENWLGGKASGPYSGRGLDNITALLIGEKGELGPEWRIETKGDVQWKIRTHANHFELIRSHFVKAAR